MTAQEALLTRLGLFIRAGINLTGVAQFSGVHRKTLHSILAGNQISHESVRKLNAGLDRITAILAKNEYIQHDTKETGTWTYLREMKLEKMWARGATQAEIAKELGLSRNAVAGKIKRMGLQRGQSRIPWTVEKIIALQEMWEEGKTQKEIAVALAMPMGAVAGKIGRMGIQRRDSLPAK